MKDRETLLLSLKKAREKMKEQRTKSVSEQQSLSKKKHL